MNEPPLEGGWDREAYSPTTPLEGAAGGAGPGTVQPGRPQKLWR